PGERRSTAVAFQSGSPARSFCLRVSGAVAPSAPAPGRCLARGSLHQSHAIPSPAGTHTQRLDFKALPGTVKRGGRAAVAPAGQPFANTSSAAHLSLAPLSNMLSERFLSRHL